MAWIDDRVWCHPKLVDIPPAARWVWVAGVAYSSGFGTRGLLSPGQQQQIGATANTRKRLIEIGLWDEMPAGHIRIHDWDEHNDKRDERRAKDRERKREQRARERRTSPAASAGRHADSPQGRRALKVVKEVTEVKGFSTEPFPDPEKPSIESITPTFREIP